MRTANELQEARVRLMLDRGHQARRRAAIVLAAITLGNLGVLALMLWWSA